jgi:hypothetical protein
VNDRSDSELAPGSLGRLAYLAGEVRGLRSEIAVLLGELGRLNAAGDAIVAQQRIHANVLHELRGAMDDHTNLLANAIEGLRAIFSLLTAPPPELPNGTARSSPPVAERQAPYDAGPEPAAAVVPPSTDVPSMGDQPDSPAVAARAGTGTVDGIASQGAREGSLTCRSALSILNISPRRNGRPSVLASSPIGSAAANVATRSVAGSMCITKPTRVSATSSIRIWNFCAAIVTIASTPCAGQVRARRR